MRKNYFVLINLLILSVFCLQAQPSGNPTSPVANYEWWKIKPIYGFPGSLIKSFEGSTDYTSGATTWKAIKKPDKNWFEMEFSGSTDFGVINTQFNKLYFNLYGSGSVSVILQYQDDDTWPTVNLGQVDASNDLTAFVSVDVPAVVSNKRVYKVTFAPQNENVFYITNVVFTRDEKLPGEIIPDYAPCIPPERQAGYYFSIYNDEPYGSVPGTNDPPGLGSEYIDNGNYFTKITLNPGSSSHVSYEYILNSVADITEFTNISFDIWLTEPLEGDRQLYVSLFAYDRATNTEGKAWWSVHSYVPQTTAAQQWVTVHARLANFDNPAWNSVDPEYIFKNFQFLGFRIDQGSSPSTFFVDNIYFYKDLSPYQSAPPPTQPQENVTSVFSANYNNISVSSWSGFDDGSIEGNDYKKVINLQSGATINLNADVQNRNLLHMDIWVEDAPNTELEIKLSDNGNTGEVRFIKTQLVRNSWNTLNILLKDFEGVDLSAIKSLSFAGTNHPIYIDNIFFYEEEEPAVTVAPIPPHEDSNSILSVYSEHFTNAQIIQGVQFPLRGTLEKQFNASNKYRLLPGMSEYAEITLGTGVSSSDWQFLHVDARAESGTSRLEVRLEGELDGNSGSTVLSQAINADEDWVHVDLSVSSASIPSGSTIKNIKLASTDGFLFLDNVYFFKSKSSEQVDVVEVVGANGGTDVNKYYSSLFDAFSAISGLDQTGAKIKVLIRKNSIEDQKISIYNSTWDSLIIKPANGTQHTITFAPLASLDQGCLFEFSGVKNLIIDGRTNQENNERLLTFVGYYNDNASYWSFDRNTILRFTASELALSEDILVRNCIFTNQALNRSNPNRSVSAITGSDVKMIRIHNNEFKNCLSLNVPNQQTLTAVVNLQEFENTSEEPKNFIVSNNYFYETENNLPFPVLSYKRNFINITTSLSASNVTISSNKIGGNSLNGSGSFIHAGTATQMECISYTYLDDVPMTGTINIENNTISNIQIDNQTTLFKYLEGGITYMEDDQVATFMGMQIIRGKVNVSGNVIENISWKTKEVGGINKLVNALLAISYVSDRENIQNSFVCTKNKIKDINLNVIPNGNHKMTIAFDGIKVIASNELMLQISDNIVIWGLDDEYEYEVTSDVSGIFVHDFSTTTVANIFNNISIIKSFKAGSIIYNSSAFWFYIQNPQSESAVFNCYNNIAYIQGEKNDYYGGESADDSGSVNGIRCVFTNYQSADKINIYHNTSFVNNIGGNQITYAIIYNIEIEGKMNSWNNNFVNMNKSGRLVALNDGVGYAGGKNPINMDYNNYYSPKETAIWDGYLFGSGFNGTTSEWKGIFTFDKWKFENTIWLTDENGRQDFHSSFVNPQFDNLPDNSIKIPLTFDGAVGLDTLLRPNAFVAGEKLSNTLPGIATDINNESRRMGLPTAGAIETELPNCWHGATSTDWNTLTNWTNGVAPTDNEDIVYHPNPMNHLILNGTRKIRNIINDSDKELNLNGNQLTITGVVRMEGTGKIDATASNSKIVYAPNDNKGAVVQHLYSGTYKNNEISNLTLTYEADYSVLLYDTLNISNQLFVQNGPNAYGKGALNCYYFDSELNFSGTTPQEIPQHAIYNDTVYDLIIDGVKVITNEDCLYVKNDLTINSGKSLEVPANKLVKVDGVALNSNDVSGLIIKSKADKPNATFIFDQDNPTAVKATVEMYSKSSMVGKDEHEYVWQYFGIPVKQIQANPTFYGSYLRVWNPEGDSISQNNFYWKQLVNGDILTPFTGYQISNPSAKAIIYQGELVTVDTVLKLPYYDSQVGYNGQHIVSNPYTASILIDQLEFGTDMDSTVYIYNTGSFKDWEQGDGQGGTVFGDKAGQYLSIPQNHAGSAGLSGEISSMQGFLVKAKKEGISSNQTLTIKYPDVVTKNTIQQRAAKSPKEKIYTIIDVESEGVDGNNKTDRIWLFTEENSTRCFDNGWDGLKISGGVHATQLFSVEEDGIYQVNTIPDINNTLVGFMPGKDGTYTFTFNHANAKQKYGNIYLLDFAQNSVTDITENGTKYDFTAYKKDKLINRFKIITRFSEEGDNWENVDLNDFPVKLFVENKTIYVLNPTDHAGEIYLYDLNGRLFNKRTIVPQNVTVIPSSLQSGMYLVKIELDDNSKMTDKVLLK